ncbi:alkylation response protein AidB-like acyl-CoA dehydrogenase [Streptomyces sp. SAI-135]|nr:acyl-CoA dehydrogenase family protein [Streptomyces sp. SAI-135]MDH6613600.1 alkylation response protein AidB-like acyl-CoA dehydrogenase [Streptomyces sp. SAI-135]
MVVAHNPAERESAALLMEALSELVASEDYAARVVEADRAGRMALDNVAALQQLGVVGLPASTRFGVDGPTLKLSVAVMEMLGRHDASTAVAINMNWAGVRTLRRFPSFPRRDEALTAVTEGRGAICGAFSNPSTELDSRKARLSCRLEGEHVVLDGRAGFGSMSDAATHAVLGGMVEASDPADPLFVLTLGRIGETGLIKHDNWSAMGMRGTGSNDIECRGLRIPMEECLIAPVSEFRRSRTADSAATAFGIAAIWVGLSEAALDFTLDHVQRRYGSMAEGTFNASTTQFRADEAWAQTGIGNMDHWLGTGRDLLHGMADRLDAGEDVPTRDLVRTLFHLRRMSEEVSMGAMKVCGAHGYVTARRLERIFRDLVGGVVMAWKTDHLQQTLGLGALGRPIVFTGPAGS